MNPFLGWALAAIALAAAWQSYRWPGVVMAVTVIVFWLLLQFGRALRVMKNAGSAPIGHIGSAVMLNAKLKRGMTLMQVVSLTRSLGRPLDGAPDSWVWRDDADSSVTLVFEGPRLARWSLERPPSVDEPTPPAVAA